MADKDVTEKVLEAYNDVFADIVNGLLFSGEKVVDESELAEAQPGSAYKAAGKIHHQERDVAKYWKNGNIRIAFYGMENQTRSDPVMPLRIIGYDGAAYRAQLLNKGAIAPAFNGRKSEISDRGEQEKKQTAAKSLYPVVTLVLYFGYKKRWNDPVRLVECLNVDERLRPYVNDYKAHVFEIAYLEEEDLQHFHSDFRIVADYFIQMRKNHDWKPSKDVICHVHEVLDLMSVLSGDDRFEQVYDRRMKEGGTTMCEVLDRVEEKGIEKGMEKGIEKGIEKGVQALVETCRDLHVSRADTLEKVKSKFEMDENVAETYMKRFW